MVPVATKPYMNNVFLTKRQRVSLHFFIYPNKNSSAYYFLCKQDEGGY